MHEIKLIVGLANPGAEYEKTRHNAGAWFVSRLASEHHITLKKEKSLHAFLGRLSHCYLAIPTTFMNLSGQAIYALSHFYRLKASEILIAHDELDLQEGVARIKFDGGAGGHNGLKDIISHLKTREFYRLRIGIGHPGARDEVTNYVLSQASKSAQAQIDTAIDASIAVMPLLLEGQIEKAMQQLHTA